MPILLEGVFEAPCHIDEQSRVRALTSVRVDLPACEPFPLRCFDSLRVVFAVVQATRTRPPCPPPTRPSGPTLT